MPTFGTSWHHLTAKEVFANGMNNYGLWLAQNFFLDNNLKLKKITSLQVDSQ